MPADDNYPWLPTRTHQCRSRTLGGICVRTPDLVIGVVEVSRDEFERVGMGGANDGEVRTVERRDLGDSKSFGCCDDW